MYVNSLLLLYSYVSNRKSVCFLSGGRLYFKLFIMTTSFAHMQRLVVKAPRSDVNLKTCTVFLPVLLACECWAFYDHQKFFEIYWEILIAWNLWCCNIQKKIIYNLLIIKLYENLIFEKCQNCCVYFVLKNSVQIGPWKVVFRR